MWLRTLVATTQAANTAKTLAFKTPAKLSAYDTLLKRLAQGLQDMTPELLPFIQEEHAMTCLQHFARHREVPAADQPHSGDRLVRGAKPAGRDHRRTLARQAGDAVEARGRKAAARVIAGKRVVSRRASIDFPTPGGPRRSTLWSKRLHDL
jgi:hypothetical protein